MFYNWKVDKKFRNTTKNMKLSKIKTTDKEDSRVFLYQYYIHHKSNHIIHQLGGEGGFEAVGMRIPLRQPRY